MKKFVTGSNSCWYCCTRSPTLNLGSSRCSSSVKQSLLFLTLQYVVVTILVPRCVLRYVSVTTYRTLWYSCVHLMNAISPNDTTSTNKQIFVISPNILLNTQHYNVAFSCDGAYDRNRTYIERICNPSPKPFSHVRINYLPAKNLSNNTSIKIIFDFMLYLCFICRTTEGGYWNRVTLLPHFIVQPPPVVLVEASVCRWRIQVYGF